MGNSSSQRIARVFAPRVRLVLFFALTWLGVAILLAFLLNEGRREAERTAQSEALGISRMLEARLAATIRRVQGDLNHLVATLPRAAFKRGMVGQYGEAVVGELALYGGYFPELAGFRVMDATGAFLYASSPVLDTASVDDRSYLSALSESASHSLYFGQVEIERRSGRSLLLFLLLCEMLRVVCRGLSLRCWILLILSKPLKPPMLGRMALLPCGGLMMRA